MRITQCDSCHVEVNDYAHWYNDKTPRNMYELKCVHESNSDTFDGMIFCHKCLQKLLYREVGESE